VAITRKWLQSASLAIDDETGELLVKANVTGPIPDGTKVDLADGAKVNVTGIGSVTVKRAKINAASNAAAGNTVVAAVTGKKLCVLGLTMIAAAAVTCTWYSGPANSGTALSGPIPLGANGGYVNDPPADPADHPLETAAGEALTLKLSDSIAVGGYLTYYEA